MATSSMDPFADPSDQQEPADSSYVPYISSFGIPPPPPPKPRNIEESLYTYSRTAADWVAVTNRDLPAPSASSSSSATLASRAAEALPYNTRIRIFSWNIDFNSRFIEERTEAQIDYIAQQLGTEAENTIVLLQEVHPWALQILLDIRWVQDNFSVTSIRLAENSAMYGTVTFVGRRLAVGVDKVWRLLYKQSHYGRDCVFVDFVVGPESQLGNVKGKGKERHWDKKILRVGNTHLESLRGGDKIRPAQVREVREWCEKDEVYACVVGGDFNAISKCDVGMPEKEGFQDFWLESGGEEPVRGEKKGQMACTWGFHINDDESCGFPPGRLDKIVGYGKVRVKKGEMAILARGLKAEIPIYDRESDEPGPVSTEYVYASDHFALTTRIHLEHALPPAKTDTDTEDETPHRS